MPPLTADALLADFPSNQIGALANLYDRFAHSLDPFSQDRDQAERIFMQEVAALYDQLMFVPEFRAAGIPLRDVRRAIILRCKRHLAATSKPSSIRPNS